jgi:hypothetical protein
MNVYFNLQIFVKADGEGCDLFSLPVFLGYRDTDGDSRATDLNLALSASKDSGVPLPVGSLTSTLYNKLSAHEEYGGRDFSVVYEYLKEGMQGGVADKVMEKLTKK